jgi:thiol-disulfide isomerase/thioredoxin
MRWVVVDRRQGALWGRGQHALRLTPFDRWLAYCAVAALVSAAVALLASAADRPRDYQPGESFAAMPGFDPSQSSGSIVIFVSTNCGACQKSTEVFQQLSSKPRPFQVAVVGYEGEDLLRQFVEVSAIEADAVLSVPLGAIRFAAVPRLALLDRRGVVRRVWSGALEIESGAIDVVASARALGGTGGP